MISLLVTHTLLLLVPTPDDFVEPPMLELGGAPSCDDARDCPWPDTPLCDTNSGQCVECLGPEHCDEGWLCGPAGFCLDACESAADCEGIDGQSVCNPDTGTCVDCLSHDDCAQAQFCTASYDCLDDHCTPGETFCFGGTIMQCQEDGGTTMEVEVCEGSCEASDGMAECVAGGGGTGETGGGEGSATDGGTSAASSASGGSGSTDSGSVDGGGCRSGSPPPLAWAWLVVLGAAIRRRRSR